jgi:hypothetical protein
VSRRKRRKIKIKAKWTRKTNLNSTKSKALEKLTKIKSHQPQTQYFAKLQITENPYHEQRA